MVDNLLYLLIGCIVVFVSSNGHLFHSQYIWEYCKPVAYLLQRVYMRIEWAVMRVAHKLLNTWLFQHSRFVRMLFGRVLTTVANGEVYTLNEINNILDILYRNYPNVYVGIRICCCRQALGNYDNDISNITDFTFIFSKIPGKKKRMQYTKFISLDEAKRLLRKFDREGFVHITYGGCARYIDGTVGLTICNCMKRRNGVGNACIPMQFHEQEAFFYHKPHNIAIIDQDKCKGVEECGKCIDLCNFDARVIDSNNGKIKIIREKCLGCALCLHHCPGRANRLVFLPKSKVHFYESIFKDLQRKYKGQTEVLVDIK